MCVWFTMYDAYIHTHIHDPWSCSMHECMILDPDVCMYDAYIIDPDTSGHDAHMYDAFIHDAWSWYMHVWCIYLCSSIIDPDTCVYDAQSNDPGPWSWSVYVCMMHLCMILVPDPECMMHVTMHLFPGFVYIWCFLMHVCMMHISIILDPSPWCMYVWCTDVWCTMHKSMILFHDPDDAWIWGGVCIYDAVLFGDQQTNQRTRRF